MNKLLLNILIFISFTTICKAQDSTFGDYTLEEMQQKSYPADTSAHAFVLKEFGSTRLDASDNGIKIYFKYHVKGGQFLTEFAGEGDNFVYSNVIQFNKSLYSSEEYQYLKELYNKIIASEKADIVFSKKK